MKGVLFFRVAKPATVAQSTGGKICTHPCEIVPLAFSEQENWSAGDLVVVAIQTAGSGTVGRTLGRVEGFQVEGVRGQFF
jgi:hypothetical protein